MTDPSRIAIILLAAGGSSRMRGRDKLLEQVSGQPLLRHVAERAIATTASEIVVVFGAKAEARKGALHGLTIRTVMNDAWASGMASSIAVGIASLSPETNGAVILLGDMPDVSTALIDRLIAAFDPANGKDIVRPVSASGPVGNPVLFGTRHFPALIALTGDTGAKPVIGAHPDSIINVVAQDDGVLIDLDTPEAWAAWRSSR